MKAVAAIFLLINLTFAAPIVHMKIDNAISVASTAYLDVGLEKASQNGAQAVIIELNTPGGLLSATRDMIKRISSSDVPVVVYVSPKGSHAASAGLYLLYASHVAAMAPGTNTGAATPVSLAPGNQEVSAQENKAISDATSYLKSLAQMRQRDEEFAKKAVSEGISITADEAYAKGVVEIVAPNMQELLQKLDGYEVVMDSQTLVTLQTEFAQIISVDKDFKAKILDIIINPNLIYILMLLAMYGILFELLNPGSILPGAVGLISGILALYGLNIVPFNYAGLLLIFIGIAFMVAEVFIVGFGILALVGVVAFVTGSLLLFDAQTLGQDISLGLIVALTLVSLGFFVYILKLIYNQRKQRATIGKEEFEGADAEVLKKSAKGYIVRCHSENWSAVSSESFSIGEIARVKAIDGLTLHIEKKER